jgi:integrase
MTTPAHLGTFGEVPDGTVWPTADTLVLLNRPLRPGTDMARLSRFGDNRWDLSPAIWEEEAKTAGLNFDLIPAPLMPAAKHYLWQLLNHTQPRVVRGATKGRIAPQTIAHAFTNSVQFVLEWFDQQQVTVFAGITHELLDDYLQALIDDESLSQDKRYRRIVEVRRLWAHRDILPASMRLPDAPPWGGADTKDLLERGRGDRENRTPRIGEKTMQTLLSWAIRFVEVLAEDILAAHDEHMELKARMPEQRQKQGTQSQPSQPRHGYGDLKAKTIAYLDRLRRRGEPLPGIRREDGQLEIRWRHIAAILDCAASFQATSTGHLIAESGLPVSEHTYLAAEITGRLDGEPWRRTRIRYEEAPDLARLLTTACLVIVAYLSGARSGEVLNLRRGCITRDEKTGLWLLNGLYFKGATDKDGNKIPEGQLRHDPWVVVELVAKAIEVMERLHPSPLIFPSKIDTLHRRSKRQKRLGNARQQQAVADDLHSFVDWVNAYCTEHDRADVIPDDGRGRLSASRFRRTLAWFIRRRPRGLIAASIQYGHAYTRMLAGYAGSYDSGFPDEYAFEDWLFRIEGLAEDEQRLAAGEHVSGPAADAYRYRVKTANGEFAGHVLTTDRQARDLVGNPLLQIHHGEGMTCVLNPPTAACQLRGAPDDPLVTPDTDNCRPHCLNLAHTDRDIEHRKQQAAELELIVDDPLAPPIRHERERHELQRLRKIIADHEQGEEDAG